MFFVNFLRQTERTGRHARRRGGVALHDDLMELASQIAKIGPGKPKQAHLRCAVSTAYYSVFHFLERLGNDPR